MRGVRYGATGVRDGNWDRHSDPGLEQRGEDEDENDGTVKGRANPTPRAQETQKRRRLCCVCGQNSPRGAPLLRVRKRNEKRLFHWSLWLERVRGF